MYNKLITNEFLNNNFNQTVNQKIIIDSLKKCHANCAFSTFPYINCNYNSKQSLDEFSSGNCISLSMFLKKYLKEHYNIESFLIPATIPMKYQRNGYLPISHVALAIPKNNKKIYIADPAFYFINPIKVRLYNKKYQTVFSKDIYKSESENDPKLYTSIDRLLCKTKKTKNKIIFNEFQEIPENTIYTECYEIKDTNDKWSYFLREIINPDESISNFFINILNRPFICSTCLDSNNICHSNIIIRLISNDELSIQYKNEPKKIIKLDNNSINLNKEILFKIDEELSRFFNTTFLDNLILYLKNRPTKFNIID